ncbi:MAG: hypothetical protein CLLPBCKN_006316 [Chroococcidiopsis cubana SAG 39.79]|nr:hypothetical protein [Chroococcidiopsis cubana SAG 39.79]
MNRRYASNTFPDYFKVKQGTVNECSMPNFVLYRLTLTCIELQLFA